MWSSVFVCIREMRPAKTGVDVTSQQRLRQKHIKTLVKKYKKQTSKEMQTNAVVVEGMQNTVKDKRRKEDN